MKKIFIIGILILVISMVAYLIIMTIGDARAMGKLSPSYSFGVNNERYLISDSNRIDFQQANSCSGYSVAYLIRHYGKEAKGDSLYKTIPEKGEMGYVAPKSVVKLLHDNGINATYRCGNLNALKNEVAKGNPVIVLIRIDTEHDWLHYVPVVGYSTDSIYLAESIQYLANQPHRGIYNRLLSTDEFKTLWNTSNWKMPLYRNTFIAIE